MNYQVLLVLGSVNSDPSRALTFMTTSFVRDLKNADNLLNAPLLRGGRVTKEDIINGYKYSQAQRFSTLKEMYKNIDAARTLGVSNAVLNRKIKRKGVKKEVFDQLMRGKFTPTRPSDFFIERLGEITRDLNKLEGVQVRNPYFEAIKDINKIVAENRNTSLSDGEVKFFEDSEPPVIEQEPRITTPNLTSPASVDPAVVQSQNVGSTLPANFASLPTADRAKIIEDFLRS
jgi:hypothetical protein